MMDTLTDYYTWEYKIIIFILKILGKIYKLNPEKPLIKNEIYDKLVLLAELEIDKIITKNELYYLNRDDEYYLDRIEYTVWSDIKF